MHTTYIVHIYIPTCKHASNTNSTIATKINTTTIKTQTTINTNHNHHEQQHLDLACVEIHGDDVVSGITMTMTMTWIWLAWRSMVMMWSAPATESMLATFSRCQHSVFYVHILFLQTIVIENIRKYLPALPYLTHTSFALIGALLLSFLSCLR